jgi:RND family efflux transporter MFP subunit
MNGIRMKIVYFNGLSALMLFLLTILLTPGCSKKQEVATTEEIRPVKTMIVKAPDLGGIRHFPGRVDASKKAELAFRVAGKVEELFVNEGDSVKKGDVIAKLDPTDFQIAVNDKKATFTRAEKDYLRGKTLVKEGNISRLDYDKLESVFLSARAALELVEQQLTYTELKAPFNGTIANRHIQKFEEIQAKQDIVTLNYNDILEIKFDLPENLILSIKDKEGIESIEQSQAKHKIPVTASFQSQTDKEYKLLFKEISTKADEKTQTFTVTYTMPKPGGLHLLPGMTTTVKIDLSQYMADEEDLFYLPVSAVVADVKLKGMVWLVNEKTMTVESVSVDVSDMLGNKIGVTKGIKKGDRVVIAGVPFLYQGLKVTLMKNSEQARDNLEHQRPEMRDNTSDVHDTKNNKPKG